MSPSTCDGIHLTLERVTKSGIVKLLSELQPLKAMSQISVTEFGMLKLTSDLQPRNAPAEMIVADSEMACQAVTFAAC